MRVALATNRYRDFCNNDETSVLALQRAERIYIPFVVLAELRAGFASGTHGPANEKVLTLFLNRARVSTLFADEATTMIYARLFFQLRKQGTPIPVHDIWIAALAAQHDLVIFTRDAQFEALPQIPRI